MAESEPMAVDSTPVTAVDAAAPAEIAVAPVAEGSAPAPVADGEPSTSAAAREGEGSSSAPHHRRKKDQEPQEPIEDVVHRRLTVIKEGDNVLLRLPSDTIKSVVVQKDGLIQLGKFGAFPARELIGRPYDITYEIVLAPGETPLSGSATPEPESRGKKGKKSAIPLKDNPGWKHVLRPQKQRAILDAIVDDIRETNEFIEDQEAREGLLMSQEEIAELKAQGVSAEEMIKRQMERHDQFELKTDFSKEKWRKRKEKKYSQTVHPLAPSTRNITNHYAERNPQAIMYLREDTMSQLLVAANVRPGGRYLVVDDTGGLVTAAIAERMGCTGRIMVFMDADSPPAWGVLNTMNFSEQELACIKWLNWMEAEPGYERPPLPTEDGMPAIAAGKTQARVRRHNAQVAELTASQNELHAGNWDAAILATDLSPVSVVKKLTPHIAGAGNLVVYSPYQQVVAETLAYTRKDPNYLATNMTESWMRTYQVLPGRTHPMMTTSAAGGYLLAATRVIPSTFVPESHQRHNKRRKKANGDATPAETTDTQEE